MNCMTRPLTTALFYVLCSLLPQPQSPDQQREIIAPKFSPGMILWYQLDVRTTHEGGITGAVEDPHGGNRLSVRFAATFKLEALPSAPYAQPSSETPAPVELRATIEQVSVAIGGDTFDPAAVALQQRYESLEGFSLLISSPAGGNSSADSHEARQAAYGGDRVEAVVKSWMRMLATGFPQRAAEPGKSWIKQEQLAGTPLKGTVLRTKYAYLRDEPCGGQGRRAAATAPSLANEPCAVIFAASTLTQSGSPSDRTPDDYRVRGLRTDGHWEGAFEDLAYVAKRTGWIISVTETQTERIKFSVSRADGAETPLHHRGEIKTQTNLLLQSVETKN